MPPLHLDPPVRVAAALHIVLACFALLVLLVIGAMVGAFGAFGESLGVERQWAEIIGGVGLIVVGALAVIAIAEIVGAVLLLRGSESGRIITLVFSALHLLNLPFGTAVGLYSLWALLRAVPAPVGATATVPTAMPSPMPSPTPAPTSPARIDPARSF